MHGRAAPKSKSINVEANLLEERLVRRERVRTIARNRVGLLFVACGLAFLVLPPMYRMERAAAAKHSFMSIQEKHMQSRLAELKKVQDTAKPIIEDQQIIASLHRHAHEFLGQMSLFLDHVNPSLSLVSVSSKVDSASIEVDAQVQAISYKAAFDFVSLASKTPNSKEPIISSMNSNAALGKDAVTFDFQQKIGVTQ
jgi:hypothetical protein